jgi:hypothetical protein
MMMLSLLITRLWLICAIALPCAGFGRPSTNRFRLQKISFVAKHNLDPARFGSNRSDDSEEESTNNYWLRSFFKKSVGKFKSLRTRKSAKDQLKLTPLAVQNVSDYVGSAQEDNNSREPVAFVIENTILPMGPRWAISSNTTDLSGLWKAIATPDFKKEYDQYLKNCSQSAFFRKVIISMLALTKDEILHDGRNLTITSRATGGAAWTRTLESSGADLASAEFTPILVEFKDPDSDSVNSEAWWEQDGTVHRSVMRGKPRVRGGEFETLRYLDDNDVLICESFFHPSPTSKGFEPGHVVWRYERV